MDNDMKATAVKMPFTFWGMGKIINSHPFLSIHCKATITAESV